MKCAVVEKKSSCTQPLGRRRNDVIKTGKHRRKAVPKWEQKRDVLNFHTKTLQRMAVVDLQSSLLEHQLRGAAVLAVTHTDCQHGAGSCANWPVYSGEESGDRRFRKGMIRPQFSVVVTNLCPSPD